MVTGSATVRRRFSLSYWSVKSQAQTRDISLTEGAVFQEQSHRALDRGCSLYKANQTQRRRSGLYARDKACRQCWTAVSCTGFLHTLNGESCYQGCPLLHSRLMIEFLWTINCPILYGAISVVGPKWGGGRQEHVTPYDRRGIPGEMGLRG